MGVVIVCGSPLSYWRSCVVIEWRSREARNGWGNWRCVELGFLMGVGFELMSFCLAGAWLQQRFSDFNT